MKNTLLLIALAMLLGNALNAQDNRQNNKTDYKNYPHWIEMMQDESVNFYDVQEAFYTYWEGRKITRSSGYKPFKRWEYMMQWRIKPNGERLPADHVWNEYQKFKATNPAAKSPSGNWENLGPFFIPDGKGYKGLGRLNAIAFHPTDPDIIFAGAPAGGLWITDDGGDTWTSYCDDLPTLGVSAIAVDYSDPDIIYMGTGDRDAGDAAGIGVLKSTDGGITWTESNTGMGNATVGRLIIHPSDPDKLYAATSAGVFITTDAGQNWTQQISGNFKEVVFKTDDPQTIYASKNGNFYKTIDGGSNWYEVTNGLPGSSRAVIAVTEANPEVVYFLTTTSNAFKALYRSGDAGESFTEMSDSPNIMGWDCSGGSGGQAWYDLDIAADPLDEDIIYAGGVNCWKSSDGGVTWQISSHWYGGCGVPSVHADLHVLEYNPVDGRLYAGNDGGIYWTDNGGASWPEITDGMPISQVYRIGQSRTVKDLVINGYQDNGTSTYNGSGWEFTRGGDGFECIIDHEDSQYSYASVYYGSVARYINNNYDMLVCENGAYGINESGAWITPYILDENDADIMFIGYKNVWRCNNVKAPEQQISWKRISYDLGGSNSTNMAVIEQSPANVNILYAGRYDGKVFRTDNARADNPVWTDLSPHLPQNVTAGDIEAHPFDENIVYITLGSKMYRSMDKGLSWEDISENLPDVNLTSIAYYRNSQDGLYVSSDLGVFFREQGMDEWVWFNQGLPVDASIREIEIFYDPDSVSKDVIRAGTYGRGMWGSDMWEGTPVAAFSSTANVIPPNCTVDFFDESTGTPYYFEWTFEGGTPSTSNERDPQGISYDGPGTYAVALKVWNDAGQDSTYVESYVTVSTDVLPEVDFIASDTIPCGTDIIEFTDLTLYCPDTWLWEFSPGDVSYMNGTGAGSQHPVVKFNSSGAYSVTLTATNANGQESLTRTDYIHIGGLELPYVEDFESGNLEDKGWTVVNPDDGITWDVTDVEGNAPGEQAAWINIAAYPSFGQRDMLVSPAMDFSAYSTLGMFFQHAYARRSSLVDSLIVKISSDCGDSWTRLLVLSTDELETAPETMNSFMPASAEDWCGAGPGNDCYFIDLGDYTSENSVKIAFESFSGYGNNIFIDNIEISNAVGIADHLQDEDEIMIYPNPSTGIFNILLPSQAEPLMMDIRSVSGQHILREVIKTGTSFTQFDASALVPGVYFISFTSNGMNVNRKIIVK
jgi:photosystem II stability/assembly factor-like uncharacterized protein